MLALFFESDIYCSFSFYTMHGDKLKFSVIPDKSVSWPFPSTKEVILYLEASSTH